MSWVMRASLMRANWVAEAPFRPVASEKLDIRLYEGNILYVRLDDFQT